jgi:hypothetical protein
MFQKKARVISGEPLDQLIFEEYGFAGGDLLKMRLSGTRRI